MRRWSGGTWFALLLIVVMAVVVGMVGWWVWTQAQDMPIGTHGMIALAVGTCLSVILAIVLMGLAVRSSRSGHDDEVGRD
jgi:hypothetical protein